MLWSEEFYIVHNVCTQDCHLFYDIQQIIGFVTSKLSLSSYNVTHKFFKSLF